VLNVVWYSRDGVTKKKKLTGLEKTNAIKRRKTLYISEGDVEFFQVNLLHQV